MLEVTCRVCGLVGEAGDFYPRCLRKCGTVGECKECTKLRVRVRALTNPAVQAYDRERAKRPHVKARIAANAKRWNEKNPEKYKAHYTLTNAVRDGRIERQPCAVCGETYAHAHHEDYSKPLDVLWLCPAHHHRLHAGHI